LIFSNFIENHYRVLNPNALVSVIIPTYNRDYLIGESIQSVLDQTFPDFELFVIDDGSTDNATDVVRSYSDSRIKFIYKRIVALLQPVIQVYKQLNQSLMLSWTPMTFLWRTR